ncbi:TrmH family RNA methyltransferase [Streptomyces sp. NPDC102467]|uniref:TrmH family RNA methyltransferase n=1 Tax=Streptomyces sp. NPDC102467 TaxID=3366179 RepID=UPI003805AFEA
MSGTSTGSGADGKRDDGPEGAVGAWRRRADAAVLLDGFHALKHALRFGADVPVALAVDRAATLALADDLAPDVVRALDALLVEVDRPVLSALVPRLHPTGVAALAGRPARTDNVAALGRTGRTTPVVILDNPRNLGNAGAVIRLAAGYGATGVVTTGSLDPWHPIVVRGGAGLHFATAVERLAVDELPGGPLYALDPEGADIRGLKLPDDGLLAFGSERNGLSPELRERADQLVALPMRAQVSSYNLATSVGMTLFHWSAHSTNAP